MTEDVETVETKELSGKEAATKFITEVKEVKDTMVSKEELEAMKAERDKLKHALLTGVTNIDSEPLKSAEDLRKDYAGAIKAGVPNLRGFETALKLRQAVINETDKDPFMSEALDRIDPNFGERVAEGIQSMIEECDNRPEVFTALLSKNLK